MRDFGIMVFTLLAIVGLSAILGIVLRNTEHDKDKDHVSNTLLRGFGILLAIFATLSIIGVVIYIVTLPFR